ncbi:MAG TPA: sodium/proline symporter [Hellea balneolensis]|uniref:Sodium/proline symporter n=1 Tax=Hellea balneolensis TaxID=287478 RepID=A0A7C5M1G1_9PROT|nr:sodium/proline symporter [Hellea balneolensis]
MKTSGHSLSQGGIVSSTTIVIFTLIAYKVSLLLIGFWASRRIHSESDFFIAGKGSGGGLGAWTAGLSYAASTSSAWVLLGYTGFVFTAGLKALWLVPGIFAGYLLTWLVMGPRLNAETEAKHHITMIDFMIEDADVTWRRRIGRLSAVLIIFCFAFYVAAQFQAAGNAFSSVFGLGMIESVILGAVIIVAYCLMGGFWAASITDMLQAVVMLAACLIVPFVTVMAAGGIGDVFSTLKATAPETYFTFSGGAAGVTALGVGIGLLGTGLGAPGQPQLLNRVMAVKDRKARLQAALITVGWGTLVYIGVTLLAFAARALMPEVAAEQIFFVAAGKYLPPVMAGIVIAAILSAVMSTVDSLLLAAASAVSHDFGSTHLLPKNKLLAGRIAMVVIAIASVILTLSIPDSIFKRVLFSWVALGAAFGPATLSRCLGWKVKGGHVFFAVLTGFLIAAIASGISGLYADLIEKWGSWIAGFVILWLGRRPTS